MNIKTKKTIIYALIAASAVVGAYYVYKALTPTLVAKQDMVAVIISHATLSGAKLDYATLMAMDTSFITAWYNSVKSNQNNFTWNSMSYSSGTGTSGTGTEIYPTPDGLPIPASGTEIYPTPDGLPIPASGNVGSAQTVNGTQTNSCVSWWQKMIAYI